MGRDDEIMVDALVDEVLADLDPLAQEKNIKLTGVHSYQGAFLPFY